jgi:hypothetical protein
MDMTANSNFPSIEEKIEKHPANKFADVNKLGKMNIPFFKFTFSRFFSFPKAIATL